MPFQDTEIYIKYLLHLSHLTRDILDKIYLIKINSMERAALSDNLEFWRRKIDGYAQLFYLDLGLDKRLLREVKDALDKIFCDAQCLHEELIFHQRQSQYES